MPSLRKEPASATTRMVKNRKPKIKNIVEITPEISTGTAIVDLISDERILNEFVTKLCLGLCTAIVDLISYKRILNGVVTNLCLPPPVYTCEKLGIDGDGSPVFIAKIEVKISRKKKIVLSGNEANTQKGAKQNAAFQAIMHLRSHFATGNTRVCLVSWIFPPMPWLKINTDGSYLGNTGFSGGGYVVRNHYGEAIMAASLPFGVVSSNTEAETKAFIAALDFCKSNPAKNFIIETDSKTIFDFILEKKGIYKGQLTPLLRKAKKIVETHGISVGHIFREANSVADSLARKASDSQQASLYVTTNISLDIRPVVHSLARKTRLPKGDLLYTMTDIPLDIRRLVWKDKMQIPNKRKF